jgi:hypothetical protein
MKINSTLFLSLNSLRENNIHMKYIFFSNSFITIANHSPWSDDVSLERLKFLLKQRLMFFLQRISNQGTLLYSTSNQAAIILGAENVYLRNRGGITIGIYAWTEIDIGFLVHTEVLAVCG